VIPDTRWRCHACDGKLRLIIRWNSTMHLNIKDAKTHALAASLANGWTPR